MNWIAAEEVCTSSQVNAKDKNVSVKGECTSDENVFQRGKTSKICKSVQATISCKADIKKFEDAVSSSLKEAGEDIRCKEENWEKV